VKKALVYESTNAKRGFLPYIEREHRKYAILNKPFTKTAYLRYDRVLEKATLTGE